MTWVRVCAALTLAAGLGALSAMLVARGARPDTAAERVDRAHQALRARLESERALGASLAVRAAEAAAAAGDRRELFARLAAFESPDWGVVVIRESVEAWSGSPPEGIAGWALEGTDGVWEGSTSWDYLWFQRPFAGGRVVAARALRPRVRLQPNLRRPAFPAEALAEEHGVTLSWRGAENRRDLGSGISVSLEGPEPERLSAEARRAPLKAARLLGAAALAGVMLLGSMFFLRSPAHGLLRHLALAASLWGARAAALAFGIPAAIGDSLVFDPSQFGTTDFFGFAGSAGELAVTAAVAALHLALSSARSLANAPGPAALALPVAFGALAWAWCEHLHAVIRHSTLDLLDPVSALPSGPVAALWVSLAAGALATFLGARLAFLAARAGAAALAKQDPGPGSGALALALCTAAALAAFRSPVALLFPLWLALLLPRRPAVPLLSVAGVFAASAIAGFVLAREDDRKEREALVASAEKVAGRNDAVYAGYAEDAASRLADMWKSGPEAVKQLKRKDPRQRALLEIWASASAARAGVPLGIAWSDGSEAQEFSLGLTAWKPDYTPHDAPVPVLVSGSIWFDYSSVVRVSDRVRIVATVRARAVEAPTAAAEAPAPFLRPRQRWDRVQDFFQGGWSPRSRLSLPPPEIEGQGTAWRVEEIGSGRFEVLYRAEVLATGSRRVWAFGRRLTDTSDRVVRSLRILFLFALFGAVTGLGGVLLARVTGALPAGWGSRLEVRLTLALVAVSAFPVSALGIFARTYTMEPVETAQRRLSQETAGGAVAGLHAIVRGEFTAVENEHVIQAENLVERDVLFYSNGKLRALGQPAIASLEIAPGFIPAAAYRRTVLAGRRYQSTQDRLAAADVTVTWAVSPSSSRAVVALPTQLRTDDPTAPAAVLAFGASTFVALLLWPLSALLARRISGPVAALTTAAEQVSAGDLTVRVTASAPGDVAALVAAFNRMTEGLARGRDAMAKAERERAWREMARQIAHEIKNPLTPLKLAVQNLRATWRAKDPEFGSRLEEAVDLSVRQIDLLARIATEFSQFAGRPNRNPAPLDVNEVLRQTVELFRPTAPAVTFVSSLAEPLPRVVADRDELTRAFTNLVKNAIQAMPGGGTLSVTSGVEAKNVVITVADTGVGIPEEIRGRMFEPYFSTKSEGTGLGLAIVKRDLEENGGSIRFESETGKGTVMRVTIPRENDK